MRVFYSLLLLSMSLLCETHGSSLRYNRFSFLSRQLAANPDSNEVTDISRKHTSKFEVPDQESTTVRSVVKVIQVGPAEEMSKPYDVKQINEELSKTENITNIKDDIEEPLGDKLKTFLSDLSLENSEQQETKFTGVGTNGNPKQLSLVSPLGKSSSAHFNADPDLVYFPDQLEYLQLHAQVCRSDPRLILYPSTGRCYPRGSQGPCHITQVLDLDPILLLPTCKNINDVPHTIILRL